MIFNGFQARVLDAKGDMLPEMMPNELVSASTPSSVLLKRYPLHLRRLGKQIVRRGVVEIDCATPDVDSMSEAALKRSRRTEIAIALRFVGHPNAAQAHTLDDLSKAQFEQWFTPRQSSYLDAAEDRSVRRSKSAASLSDTTARKTAQVDFKKFLGGLKRKAEKGGKGSPLNGAFLVQVYVDGSLVHLTDRPNDMSSDKGVHVVEFATQPVKFNVGCLARQQLTANQPGAALKTITLHCWNRTMHQGEAVSNLGFRINAHDTASKIVQTTEPDAILHFDVVAARKPPIRSINMHDDDNQSSINNKSVPSPHVVRTGQSSAEKRVMVVRGECSTTSTHEPVHDRDDVNLSDVQEEETSLADSTAEHGDNVDAKEGETTNAAAALASPTTTNANVDDERRASDDRLASAAEKVCELQRQHERLQRKRQTLEQSWQSTLLNDLNKVREALQSRIEQERHLVEQWTQASTPRTGAIPNNA